MNGTEPIATIELLKQVHISKLNVIMCIYMVGKTSKKTVLVKIIIQYLPAKIDMDFVIQDKRKVTS